MMRYDYTRVKSKKSNHGKIIFILALLAGISYGVYHFWPEPQKPVTPFAGKLLWQKPLSQFRPVPSLLDSSTDKKQITQNKPLPNKKKNIKQNKTPNPSPSQTSEITLISPLITSPRQDGIFSVISPNQVNVINHEGKSVLRWSFPPESIWEKSENGLYLLRYQKTGSEILLYNNNGQLIWKRDTKKYPILSPTGSFFLLVAADAGHTGLYNRFQSVVHENLALGMGMSSVSWNADETMMAIGFLDGTFVLACTQKKWMKSMRIHPWIENAVHNGQNQFLPIKSVQLSPNGENLLLHIGHPPNQDYLAIMKLPSCASLDPADASHTEKNQKITKLIKMIDWIKIKQSIPHSLPMAIQNGAKPMVVYWNGTGIVFRRAGEKKWQTKQLWSGSELFHKSAKNTQNTPLAELSQTITWMDSLSKIHLIRQKLLKNNSRTNTPFTSMRFSVQNDLSLLISESGQIDLYLFQSDEENGLQFRQFFQLGAGLYGRSIYLNSGKKMLVETNRQLYLYSLYNQ